MQKAIKIRVPQCLSQLSSPEKALRQSVKPKPRSIQRVPSQMYKIKPVNIIDQLTNEEIEIDPKHPIVPKQHFKSVQRIHFAVNPQTQEPIDYMGGMFRQLDTEEAPQDYRDSTLEVFVPKCLDHILNSLYNDFFRGFADNSALSAAELFRVQQIENNIKLFGELREEIYNDVKSAVAKLRSSTETKSSDRRYDNLITGVVEYQDKWYVEAKMQNKLTQWECAKAIEPKRAAQLQQQMFMMQQPFKGEFTDAMKLMVRISDVFSLEKEVQLDTTCILTTPNNNDPQIAMKICSNLKYPFMQLENQQRNQSSNYFLAHQHFENSWQRQIEKFEFFYTQFCDDELGEQAQALDTSDIEIVTGATFYDILAAKEYNFQRGVLSPAPRISCGDTYKGLVDMPLCVLSHEPIYGYFSTDPIRFFSYSHGRSELCRINPCWSWYYAVLILRITGFRSTFNVFKRFAQNVRMFFTEQLPTVLEKKFDQILWTSVGADAQQKLESEKRSFVRKIQDQVRQQKREKDIVTYTDDPKVPTLRQLVVNQTNYDAFRRRSVTYQRLVNQFIQTNMAPVLKRLCLYYLYPLYTQFLKQIAGHYTALASTSMIIAESESGAGIQYHDEIIQVFREFVDLSEVLFEGLDKFAIVSSYMLDKCNMEQQCIDEVGICKQKIKEMITRIMDAIKQVRHGNYGGAWNIAREFKQDLI